jgi:hypothetical protein
MTTTHRLFILSSEFTKLRDCTLLPITKPKRDRKEDQGENGMHQGEKKNEKRGRDKVQYSVGKEQIPGKCR